MTAIGFRPIILREMLNALIDNLMLNTLWVLARGGWWVATHPFTTMRIAFVLVLLYVISKVIRWVLRLRRL